MNNEDKSELFSSPTIIDSTTDKTHSLNFFNLVYTVLFQPNIAANTIKSNLKSNSSTLWIYSLIILFLSFGAKAISEGSPNSIISGISTWFFSVLCLAVIAWLFSNHSKDNIQKLFLFTALAQIPLILSGVGTLWSNSSFNIVSIDLFIHLWVICLWGWSLYHAFDIGFIRSFILTIILLMGPLLFIFIFAISLIITVMGWMI